jgi:FkbM family methyltransferase
MSSLRRLLSEPLRKFTRSFGFDLVNYSNRNIERPKVEDARVFESPSKGFVRLLELHGVDLVFDIGANVGYYARDLFAFGFKGRVVSVEPTSAAFIELRKASQSNSLWEVTERCAIGQADGQTLINISGYSDASSILPILDECVQAAPQAAYVGQEEVQVRTVDWLVSQYRREAKAPFLKLDVQGYEQQALAGASESLASLKGLQIELSLIPLYSGQMLFRDMLDQLVAKGFELYALLPGFTDPRDGRLLQVDGVFFRHTS